MDMNEVALEFAKIYYACHPAKLSEDKEKAFQDINQLHGKYKSRLIDSATKKSQDFFSDKL